MYAHGEDRTEVENKTLVDTLEDCVARCVRALWFQHLRRYELQNGAAHRCPIRVFALQIAWRVA